MVDPAVQKDVYKRQVLYDSRQFTAFSDVTAPAWSYFGLSLLLFGGIYLIYFTATYVEFKRNLKS